jgi:hypothetical protein
MIIHFAMEEGILNITLEQNVCYMREEEAVQFVSDMMCSLTHELSSLASTLGSWVRIPLKAWMLVCAFILCLCCPVCR